MFTLDNTDGFTQSDLDLMNAALAVYIERNSAGETDPYWLGQIEKSGSDLINNTWADSGNTVESLLAR